MHTKIAFLFFLVLFGAYAEHQAGKTVKRLKVRDRRMIPKDTTSEGHDATYIKKRLEIIRFEMPRNNDITSVQSLDRILRQFYCISAEENTSYRSDWQVERVYNQPSKTPNERAIRKNSILSGAHEKSVLRCRQA